MNKIALAVMAASVPLAAAAADIYTIDPYHSFPYFDVSHLNLASIRGRFDKTSGTFSMDRAARTGSLEVTVQTASVTTGDNDRGGRPRTRDEHLRTPDFFNIAEFPTMTFKSTKVTFKGDQPATIDGNLTMIGVTKPLSLHVEHWNCITDNAAKRERCGGVATSSFKRSEYGMKYGVPLLGDEIKLWIGFEGLKQP